MTLYEELKSRDAQFGDLIVFEKEVAVVYSANPDQYCFAFKTGGKTFVSPDYPFLGSCFKEIGDFRCLFRPDSRIFQSDPYIHKFLGGTVDYTMQFPYIKDSPKSPPEVLPDEITLNGVKYKRCE